MYVIYAGDEFLILALFKLKFSRFSIHSRSRFIPKTGKFCPSSICLGFFYAEEIWSMSFFMAAGRAAP